MVIRQHFSTFYVVISTERSERRNLQDPSTSLGMTAELSTKKPLHWKRIAQKKIRKVSSASFYSNFCYFSHRVGFFPSIAYTTASKNLCQELLNKRKGEKYGNSSPCFEMILMILIEIQIIRRDTVYAWLPPEKSRLQTCDFQSDTATIRP